MLRCYAALDDSTLPVIETSDRPELFEPARRNCYVISDNSPNSCPVRFVYVAKLSVCSGEKVDARGAQQAALESVYSLTGESILKSRQHLNLFIWICIRPIVSLNPVHSSISLSEFEVNELLLGNLEALSQHFQYWMTATFAVVVASYTAGDRLALWARVVVAALYVAAVAVAYIRWQGSVGEASRLIRLLVELGYDSTSAGRARLAGGIREGVMLGGTLLAIVLICFPAIANRKRKRAAADR